MNRRTSPSEEYEEEEEKASSLPPRSPARCASPNSVRRAVEARVSTASNKQDSVPKAPDPAVLEAKKEFFKYMDDNLLDYKHNHPINVSNCVSTLLKIFNNVLEHPEDQKFRQVKAGGNAFKNNISSIKGGEKLMTLAGWRVQRKRHEMQAAGAMEKARKEQILRAVEEDKEDRKLRTG
ncbi:hypothetical protein DUNSADRAFT_11173 [Dunaliella salina]|uniref:PUB domain-containing protein n=1 Tax=Dunaliella salina TaxID=3046 RepID=A0ABQ7GE05_DUNSA|nr:hypothetical protein DUNSADRAFT_11173 [Dunaliella salina]|eukprot:KAF5832834.1 hypothetical protein DUNSADRAFT_11173 [Dunaliella salina]